MGVVWRQEGNVLFNDALNIFYFTDIWRQTTQIVREETCCCHMGYSFWLTARVLLYAPSHREDTTYHSLCYTSRGALAGARNSSMGPPHEGSIWRPIAPWANALTTELHLAPMCCMNDSRRPVLSVETGTGIWRWITWELETGKAAKLKRNQM